MSEAPTERTDMDRLRAAFTEFRALGYWARVSQPDSIDAVPQDVIKRAGKFVLWNEADTPRAFGPDGQLINALQLQHFERDAEEIERLLTQHGLLVDVQEIGRQKSVFVYPQVEVE